MRLPLLKNIAVEKSNLPVVKQRAPREILVVEDNDDTGHRAHRRRLTEGGRLRSRAAYDGRRRPTLLIALTGYRLPKDRNRALDAGFDGHLVKPVDEAALEKLLSGTDASERQVGKPSEIES